MPFDPTSFAAPSAVKLRDPEITILPPTPPKRGDGPRRIVVNIEIVSTRQRKRRYRFGTFTLVLFLVLLFAALAHAQPRYEHWQSTDGWHGEVRTEGNTTDWTDYGPAGRQRHCHRYFVGDPRSGGQAYTTCH